MTWVGVILIGVGSTALVKNLQTLECRTVVEEYSVPVVSTNLVSVPTGEYASGLFFNNPVYRREVQVSTNMNSLFRKYSIHSTEEVSSVSDFLDELPECSEFVGKRTNVVEYLPPI